MHFTIHSISKMTELLSRFLHSPILLKLFPKKQEEISIVAPAELDITHYFLENLHHQVNYRVRNPTSEQADLKVNLKLKTRQLLYGENKTMGICLKCGVYLKEFLMGSESKSMIDRFEIDDPKGVRALYKKFLMTLEPTQIQDMLNVQEDFDVFFKKILIPLKSQGKSDNLLLTTELLLALTAELESNQNREGGIRKRLGKEAMSDAKFELIQKQHQDLSDRVEYINQYEAYLMKLKDKCFVKVGDVMNNKMAKRTEKIEKKNSIIDQIRFGSSINNKDLDRFLSKNRKCTYSKVKSAINIKPQCKDLIENLVSTEKERLRLFGEYALPILKVKKILVKYEMASELEYNQYTLVILKKETKYILNLIYSNKKTGFFANLFHKPNFNEYDEILEKT